MSDAYPLAPDGVFETVQGEGRLIGLPMVFVRFAGCGIACPGCDTDYRVGSRATAADIARRVVEAASPATEWVWVTGGEPTLHELAPLLAELRRTRLRVALATAGERDVRGRRYGFDSRDFLSVSPHRREKWVQREGDQINLVPGLHGLRLADWADADFDGFAHRYVTPLHGDAASLAECLEWVKRMPGWRLGVQAHKHWGMA